MIDSIGFKDEKVWIDENANPHSDALHVVERWTRPDADHIHVETLIEDPKFYTRPFTYSRTWVLGQPDEELQEYSCSENNVNRDHLGSDRDRSGRTGHAATSIRRRCRRRSHESKVAGSLGG